MLNPYLLLYCQQKLEKNHSDVGNESTSTAYEIFAMNRTILTLLSSSCVFYLFVLMSHAAVAEGKSSVATITSASS